MNRGLLVLTVIFSMIIISTSLSTERNNVLKAGIAKIDITPSQLVILSGYESRKGLSQGVHDSLSARVVAFEKNGKRLVLVSTDIIGFYGGTDEYLKNAILDEFALEPSELFLSAIHTHSAPSLSIDREKGHPNNIAYTKTLKSKLINAIRKALDDMSPIKIGVGAGSSPVGVNRREVIYDSLGNGRMWLGRNPYGTTDKEVLVMKMADVDGRVRAVLFDYATHSTCMGMNNYMISGDVHGLAEQFVEKYLGENIIAPAYAGTSGDIDPWYRILPEFHTKNGWIPEPVLLGTLLGEEVVHVFQKIKSVSKTGDIKTAIQALELPGKPRGENQSPKDHPTPLLNITVATIGDIAFVGIGGEVFNEIGKAIKAASPTQYTFVITHCNGAASYLPSEHVYIEGGYEVQTSPFAPQAAKIVVKEVVKMLHEL